ncbi:1,6-dihydroxycyclohexa-2,4-diene-1-carboxylate dehydrogenase [Burkholderia ambifaria]|uniref:Short-chain dehydrogenase/reductase SDR n=1 Tax=Burkholderia ambifaria (strain ATCC BAA-244 / DSM 16087 / CCUG 44356 / LMG 19182 / AMMD) TaxID=339670 RepID=Q0B148_BURCM|nr:benzoate diol dehydrogenase BenD [Burkholderia ambifaria]ABI92125.1 short-chain dehydrogenase/reductase SDR [Burkholderia ambifaria AMMD]MBR7933843.1 1,6-dihydroxycyclohexa-2,4-diene-1-carboxylate dehydrogenase [Burkholderia ambifaria]PEH70061.1 1,6-dihydroxycyclohexa-2,4-diene-1-carboxylate dehydrogenase [Burkholderia ambifaria]QQC08770.1 1,6-dihydroxycyclohexa-2,4-diene-1-carboxylate dehydrogenase [Burkholderia ambifaria]UZU00710.1 benzoate diol dehydrogenase BenD [Burkholderia ambifaria]
MTMQRFSGKVVVVTGAAQGIGRGVALRAAAEGGRVLFVDRAEFVAEVAAEAPGGDTAGFVADLETYDGAHAAMAFAVATFGRIDVLINGVGGAIRMRPFAEFEPAQIDAEIRRSLMPTLYSCHAVLPHLLAGGGGTIVNVSSNATRGIRRVPYSAAKGGVNALTAALAMEYAEHGIRVVATAPGGTAAPPRRVPRNAAGDSEQEQAWMAEAVRQVTDSTFFKRYGSLDEQIAPILFLASDEASYITGTVLPVAGGDTG